jgi:hypothetical protein
LYRARKSQAEKRAFAAGCRVGARKAKARKKRLYKKNRTTRKNRKRSYYLLVV